MKKWIIGILAAVLVIAVAGTVLATTMAEDALFQIGKAYDQANQKTRSAGQVVAEFRGETITQTEVDYYRTMAQTGYKLFNDSQNPTDREIVDDLLEKMIWTAVAEEQGYTATEEEIEEIVDGTRQAYELPDGKKMIDDFLQGSGLTLEEYQADVRSQGPGVVIRKKYQDDFLREYCRQNGLDVETAIYNGEAYDAFDVHLNELFVTYQSEIVYYD